jgi:hypothetical protein
MELSPMVLSPLKWDIPLNQRFSRNILSSYPCYITCLHSILIHSRSRTCSFSPNPAVVPINPNLQSCCHVDRLKSYAWAILIDIYFPISPWEFVQRIWTFD